MIAAAFDYFRPSSLADALTLLARHGDDARALAGGHSLVPAMKLRLVEPRVLVDLSRVPELQGLYLYADYVTNKLWALKYDDKQKRVVANHSIPDKGVPVMSFGEDEQGDVYFMTYTGTGRGIRYAFVRPDHYFFFGKGGSRKRRCV